LVEGDEHQLRSAGVLSPMCQFVSLEAPAAETDLVIPSPRPKGDEIHIGLSWTEGLGKLKLTKIITLAPRFYLKNELTQAISFRQHGVAPQERSVVEPNQRFPLYNVRFGQEKLLTIAYPGLDAQW
jgi:vacuolar protein sorting-associated protein 13A/C